MKKLIFIFLLVTASQSFANEKYFNKIVDAIYIAEGGSKTKHPYGILSVKVKSVAHARKICLQTVRNNHKRWLKSKSQKEFLAFLANVYCPVGAENDPTGLNANWERNVKKILKGRVV